jgi:hypothetical protein
MLKQSTDSNANSDSDLILSLETPVNTESKEKNSAFEQELKKLIKFNLEKTAQGIIAAIAELYPQHQISIGKSLFIEILNEIIKKYSEDKKNGSNDLTTSIRKLDLYAKIKPITITLQQLLQRIYRHIFVALQKEPHKLPEEACGIIASKLCFFLYATKIQQFFKDIDSYKIEEVLDRQIKEIVPEKLIEEFISKDGKDSKNKKKHKTDTPSYADSLVDEKEIKIQEFKNWILSSNTSLPNENIQKEVKTANTEWSKDDNKYYKPFLLFLNSYNVDSKLQMLLAALPRKELKQKNSSDKQLKIIDNDSEDKANQSVQEIKELQFNKGYAPNPENQKILQPSSVKSFLENTFYYSENSFFAFIFTVITNFGKLKGFLESHSKIIFPIAPFLDLINFLFKGIDFIISPNKNIQKGGEAAFSFFKFAATTTVVAGATFAFMSPLLVHILFTGIVATGFVWSVGSLIFHVASSVLAQDKELKQYHRANAKKAAIGVGLSSISAIALAGVFFIQTVVPIVPLLLGLAAVVAIAIGSGIKIYYQLKAKNTSKQEIELQGIKTEKPKLQNIVNVNFQSVVRKKIEKITNQQETTASQYKNNTFFSDSNLYGTLEAKVNAVDRKTITYTTLKHMIQSKCKALIETMTQKSASGSEEQKPLLTSDTQQDQNNPLSKGSFFTTKPIEQQKIEGLAALLVYLKDTTEAKTYSVVKFEHFVKELCAINPKLFSATSKGKGEVEALFDLAKLHISYQEQQGFENKKSSQSEVVLEVGCS